MPRSASRIGERAQRACAHDGVEDAITESEPLAVYDGEGASRPRRQDLPSAPPEDDAAQCQRRCGTPEFEDERLDTLLNPTLLIEVLSPTTERHDRGCKAEQYRRIESVSEYLLVAQTEPRIEQYRRRGEREWLLTETSGLDETVALSIDCVISLRDVYDTVF